MSNLRQTQINIRKKEEVEIMKKCLFEAPEFVKKSMWDSIVKDCPYYYKKVQENPLSESEFIQMINNNNLVDKQILNICKFLRDKWGNKVLTPNIAKKLVKRKSMLDQFFTEVRLNSSTDLHLKGKRGNK
jgi:hypothetical protein